MSLAELVSQLQGSTPSHVLSHTNHLFVAGLQILHILGFITLLASQLLVTLRLFGRVFAAQPLRLILRPLQRLAIGGLVLALGSGVLMFLTGPVHYYYNSAFDTKMGLLAIALTCYTVLSVFIVGKESTPGHAARFAFAASLLLWLGVCMAGRAIGFV